jgi:hypothetical protein
MAQLEWFTAGRHRYIAFEGRCITFNAFCRRFKLSQTMLLKRMYTETGFDKMIREAIQKRQIRCGLCAFELPTDEEIRTVFFWSKPIEEIK